MLVLASSGDGEDAIDCKPSVVLEETDIVSVAELDLVVPLWDDVDGKIAVVVPNTDVVVTEREFPAVLENIVDV